MFVRYNELVKEKIDLEDQLAESEKRYKELEEKLMELQKKYSDLQSKYTKNMRDSEVNREKAMDDLVRNWVYKVIRILK